MNTFPTLSTGAVAQYPLRTTYTYRADVVAFLDGSEQRFRNSPAVIHAWTVSLAALSEQEMATLASFFLSNQGSAGVFTFTDPATSVAYTNCSLAEDEMDQTYTEALSSGTNLLIRENRT